MPIKICPIERSDAKVITEIQFGAFEDDPVNTLMYGGPPSTSVLAWTVEHTLNKWDENPVVKRMGVRDIATGELIAYSEWSFNPQREGDDWAKVPSMEWSKEHNKEVMDWLMTAHLNMNIKIMGPKPYICKATNFVDLKSCLNVFLIYRLCSCRRSNHIPSTTASFKPPLANPKDTP